LGKEENGSWTGLFGMIQREEVDFSISAFSSEPNQVPKASSVKLGYVMLG
jgi:hypothetical protein